MRLLLLPFLFSTTVVFAAPDIQTIDTSTGTRTLNNAISSTYQPSLTYTMRQSAQTLKKNKESIDTVAAKAAVSARCRDLAALFFNYEGTYQHRPLAADSLYSPTHIIPQRIFNSDEIDLPDILRNTALFSTVPYALSSGLSRSLYLGHPGLVNGIFNSGSFQSILNTSQYFSGFENAGSIRSATISPIGALAVTSLPADLVKPETVFAWENGVFSENNLSVRFARPLAKTIRLGIFTGYRSVQRSEFDHSRSGILNFYQGICQNAHLDTLLLSSAGSNPQAVEMTTTLDLAWQPSAASWIDLKGSYDDRLNDIPEHWVDTLSKKDTIAFAQLSRYSHEFLFTGRLGRESHPLFGIFSFGSAGNVTHDVLLNRLNFSGRDRRGQALSMGGSAGIGYQPTAMDTIIFAAGRESGTIVRWNNQSFETRTDNAGLRLFTKRTLPIIPHCDLSLDASAGIRRNAIDKMIDRSSPVFSAVGTGNISGQSLSLFGAINAPSIVLPYDTARPIDASHTLSHNSLLGFMAGLGRSDLKLNAGVAFIHSNTTADSLLWPTGFLPYSEPSRVIFLNPSIGSFAGASLVSSTQISDCEPFIRSRSDIIYDITGSAGHRHVIFDLGFNYWSPRVASSYLSARDATQIYDLSLATTVQISSFRLFYKIDNILNRRIVYVPGNEMPGLTFRWGFNWAIQG